MAKFILICISMIIAIQGGRTEEGCRSPQYLELGKSEKIICTFENFFGILWFNSTDYVTDTPLVFLKNDVTEGKGYESGEFDVGKNGSLIISNVSLRHDHIFTVIKLNSLTDDYDPVFVRVIVTVIPQPPFALIEPCDRRNSFCYASLQPGSNLTCLIKNAKPANSLVWLDMTFDITRAIPMITKTTEDNRLSTTVATTTDLSLHQSPLKLFICRTDDPQGLLIAKQSLILAENSNVNFSKKKTTESFETNSTLKLICGKNAIELMVWKFSGSEFNTSVILSYGALVNHTFMKFQKDGVSIDRSGALSIPEVKSENEGLYECTYHDGTSGGASLYEIDIFDAPTTTTRSITTPQAEPVKSDPRNGWLIILTALIATTIVSLVVVSLLCVVRAFRRRRQKPATNDEGELHQMLPKTTRANELTESPLADHKERFSTHLKRKYEKICAVTYPVPFLRSQTYSVEEVFVESSLQARENVTNWRNLNSHHEIFSFGQSNRCIITGDAGYGKSILCLQLAFDWYTGCVHSPLRDKHFLIFLRLRQLRGIYNVYTAIKHLLLPKDTVLTEDSIKHILQNSESVTLILDGYDEYPDQNVPDSFIMDIIKGNELQHCEVILTTRPNFLPNEIAQAVKLIRLTGFESAAQEKYVENISINVKNDSDKTVKEALQKYPFLDEFCQIPLYFAMFSYISSNSQHLQNRYSLTNTFRYLLSCLQSHSQNKAESFSEQKHEMLQHDHLQNFQKLAFDSLSERTPPRWKKDKLLSEIGQVLYNEYVAQGLLVEEDYYIANDPGAGVPVQGKSVRFLHNFFREWFAAHFLARYAAESDTALDERYEASDVNTKPTYSTVKVVREILDKSDISSLAYMLRFACGLRPDAAENIRGYLKSRTGGNKLEMLCVLEEIGTKAGENTLKEFAHHPVLIQDDQTELEAKCSIQLLKIASSLQIQITNVLLSGCFQTAKIGDKCMTLKQGIQFPSLDTLTKLVIRQEDTIFSNEDTCGILSYSMSCPTLKTLRFEFCLLPKRITCESLRFPKHWRTRVLWETDFTPILLFEVSSGYWKLEIENTQLTDNDYNQMEEVFEKTYLRRNKVFEKDSLKNPSSATEFLSSK